MANFIRTKIIDPLKSVFTQGLSPEALAMSFAFGITGGLFPIPGITTLVCLVFIYLFSLNPIATQTINLLLTPLNLLLVFPLIKLGDFLLRSNTLTLSSTEMSRKLQEDLLGFITTFWRALIHGVFAWAVLTPIFTYAMYRVLLVLFRISKFEKRLRTQQRPD